MAGVDKCIITAGFDLFISTRYAVNPALKLFLLNHPNRPIAEFNCLKSVRECEIRLKNRFKKKQLEELIILAATLLCEFAIKKREKDNMSAAELKRHEQKAGELADTQAMVDEWAKEAMSTAVTKAVQGLRDGGQEAGKQNEHSVGGDRGPSPEVRSAGDNPGDAGANA